MHVVIQGVAVVGKIASGDSGLNDYPYSRRPLSTKDQEKDHDVFPTVANVVLSPGHDISEGRHMMKMCSLESRLERRRNWYYNGLFLMYGCRINGNP